MKRIVHVVGTGTIGEPLLGLFTDFRERLGIDEVTFHKRTPLAGDRSRLKHLIERLAKGTFVCMRRSNDISQADSFVPAPNVGKHDDPDFGTHHARDAYHVFETMHKDLNLFSSAVKLNTQYMHSIWFNLELTRDTTVE